MTKRAFKWSKSRGRVKVSRDPSERGYVDKKHMLGSLRKFLFHLLSPFVIQSPSSSVKRLTTGSILGRSKNCHRVCVPGLALQTSGFFLARGGKCLMKGKAKGA